MITVIVPCYNVEKYIDRCVNSLVKQTIGISFLQLILVNDASTDGTLSKMMEWEENYSDNILIISYDENLRQGGARNRGLEYVEGECIFFLDADDYIEEQTLEEMYSIFLRTDSDVVKCKLEIDSINEEFHVSPGERKDVFWEKPGDGGRMNSIPDIGNNGRLTGAAGTLYKSRFIAEHNLRFPEHLAYEDNFWNEIVGLLATKVYIIDQNYYHYWFNNESTTNKRNDLSIMNKITIETMILEEYVKRGLFELYKTDLFFEFIQRGILNLMYHIYTRFDYLPIDLCDLREILWIFFGEFRGRINIDAFKGNICDYFILEMLFDENKYSMEEQEVLKQKYLAAM